LACVVRMPRFRTIKLEVDPNETVEAIKLRLSKEGGYPLSQQRLVHDGAQIPETATLAEYNISSGSTLHLVLTPGETKKKQKNATAPY